MAMTTLSPQQLHAAARKEMSWVVGAFRQFFADRCPALAASIAFYSAFSLAPTLVMVIAVAGWFFGDAAARGELFRHVYGVLGNEAAAGVTTIVENAHRSAHAGGIAAVISFAMLAVGASATFSSLNYALNVVWPPTKLRASTVFALVRVRLVSFSLVLGVAFLLIVSLVLDTTITFVGQWLLGQSRYLVIGDLLQLLVGLVVLAVAFAALLKFLPDANVQWRDALVGGGVAAVLFSAGKKLFALYLAHAGMASTFGAAGSLAVLLMWLYFSAAVLLLGAEFSAARARLHDPRGAWGRQPDAPPGSRAKLASVLAASTLPGLQTKAAPPAPGETPPPDSPRPSGERQRTHDKTPPADDEAVSQNARAAANDAARNPNHADAPGQSARAPLAQLEGNAARAASAAHHYVRQHSWRSVLLAAGAAMAVAATTTRRHGGNGEKADESGHVPAGGSASR
ncbi:hypothetical protein CY652_02425 [Burkholderia sp. WAC0059]|uniref:YihY/virulence factor BrkB family protein n=1 Tax=Burkholderia sp. WAC0059 TaxID=2066022 RepID=UPI000C7EA372|nr:YihY/virulence factor BrkB family protein [Burkholderia sp. WAC0059]PLZ04088.1 hypothetical protein CY652_02425 [Burkholderia sp. WAC0059]